VRAILKHRVLFLSLLSVLLLILEPIPVVCVPAVGVFVYYVTVGVLELLENAGLPTLTGSPDGWPVPTTWGLVISALGWFLVCFGSLAAFFALISRRQSARAEGPRNQ
jgi:hypothetical protein